MSAIAVHLKSDDRGVKNCVSTYSGFYPYSISDRRYSIQAGFTLLELLVVLVIISVMVAFVGPRLAGSITNMNLKAVSKRIAASLRYARSQAISESRPYEAVFDLDKHLMIIRSSQTAQEDDQQGEGTEPVSRPPKSYKLPDDVRLEKAIWKDQEGDSGLFRILFVSNGGSSGGELLLRNDRGHRYRITVDVITGTVRVESDETER